VRNEPQQIVAGKTLGLEKAHPNLQKPYVSLSDLCGEKFFLFFVEAGHAVCMKTSAAASTKQLPILIVDCGQVFFSFK